MGFLAALPVIGDIAGLAGGAAGAGATAAGVGGAAGEIGSLGGAISNIGTTPGSSLLAAATGIGMAKDILGGFSKQGQYDAQAQIARNNAIIARQNAAYSAQEGEAKGEQLGLRTRGQVAEIAARQAGSGLDPNSGSALDVRKSAGMLGALDALTARSQAARQAYGYQIKAQQSDIEEQQARKAAKLAPFEGVVGGLTSLLGGAASLQNQYKQWQQASGAGLNTADAGGGIGDSGDFESAFG